MSRNRFRFRRILAALIFVSVMATIVGVSAAFAQSDMDSWRANISALPVVSSSPVTGLLFDDPPHALPESAPFRNKLNAVADKLGRMCLVPEIYGWPLNPDEQPRVDKIFASAVGHLRDMGYRIVPQDVQAFAPGATGFSAESSGDGTAAGYGRDILMLWSGSQTGLVLLLCETQPKATPLPSAPDSGDRPMETAEASVPGAQSSPYMAMPDASSLKSVAGVWRGTYSCLDQGLDQGKFKASLVLHTQAHNKLSGSFSITASTEQGRRFKPASYAVSGEYDPEGLRALILPGSWIERGVHVPHVPMIATFYPEPRQISGIFQGISDCTSFEGTLTSEAVKTPHKKIHRKKVHHKKAKRKTMDETPSPAPSAVSPPVADIPAAPAPSVQSAPPAATGAPAAGTEVTPPAPLNSPVGTSPAVPEAPAALPATTPPPPTTPAPLPTGTVPGRP